MIEIKTDPTVRELRIFAVLWLVFFVVLGKIAVAAGDRLLIVAAVIGVCFLVSLVFNREFSRRTQIMGAVFPVGLVVLWGAGRLMENIGAEPVVGERALFLVLIAIGIVGSAAVFGWRAAGLRIYRGWMLAAMPIGWTLSNVMLMAVFYGVVTPVGLAMRFSRRDPMTRRIDKAAPSYWAEHRPATDSKRYFRQF